MPQDPSRGVSPGQQREQPDGTRVRVLATRAVPADDTWSSFHVDVTMQTVNGNPAVEGETIRRRAGTVSNWKKV